MTVLVVGAGLIGSQIARLEIEKGEEVVIFDAMPRIDALSDILKVEKSTIVQGDIMNPFDITRVMKNKDIRYVYHTAAYPGFTIGSQMNPYAAIQLNVMGFVSMLEAARLHDVKTVLFTSSSVLSAYVRAPADGTEFSKEYAYPRPSTFYSSTKLACENFGLNYAESYGLDFVAVRFAAVFGPWRYGGGGGPTTLIREMVSKSIKGEPISVASSDFEYVYSKDAARGALMACHSSRKDRIFNIGMGRIYNLSEIARMIKGILPRASISVSQPNAGQTIREVKAESAVAGGASDERSNYKLMPNPDFSLPLDLSRSSEQLGYQPMYPMLAALKDYVESLRTMNI